MKKLTYLIIAMFVAGNLFAEETGDHTKFEELKQKFATANDVTKACLSCHTEAGKQMMKTIHWTWSKKTKGGRETGKAMAINNFCVAVPSNEPRCTSCHVGYGWKNNNFDFTSETNIDCLVCHEQTGQYKKFPTAAGHPVYEEKMFDKKVKFSPADLDQAAQSVARPTSFNCGVCHFYGGGGNGVKHGDLDKSLLTASKNLDVHIGGEGMHCVDCHKADKHFIPGTKYEYADKSARPTCDMTGCHDVRPHKISKLNDHADVVACQTCHIPKFARGGYPTKMWWDWSKAGDKKRKNDKNYNVKKGEFVWAVDAVPDYRWHNGNVRKHFLATDKFDPKDAPIVLNELDGSCEDPDSKIYPFKIHRGKQIYDKQLRNFIIPQLFGGPESGAYWKEFDWNKASKSGMDYIGLEYSGSYDFIETMMYWPITHMVAPKEEALQCNDCHTRDPEGRMAEVAGVHLPGRDFIPLIDYAGVAIVALSLLGAIFHSAIGNLALRKNAKEKEEKAKEDK